MKQLSENLKLYFVLIFIFLAGIFLVHYLLSGQAVYGDGIGHYAYLHSWYFDGNNDFTNEYQHLYNYQNNNSNSPLKSDLVQIVGTNSEGRALNHFSPGMAILLLPFYILADGVVVLSNFFGASLARNGYSNTYQLVSGLGAVFYVVLALWLSEKLLKLFNFKAVTRRTAVFTLLLATNLLYYGSFDVLNSHFASFFLSVLFFWYFFKHRSNLSRQNYFLLGVMTGLMTITRPQDGLIILVVLVNARLSLKINKERWSKLLTKLLAFFVPLILIVAPLGIQWATTFDSINSHPYFAWIVTRDNLMIWNSLLGTLFHSTNGLFFRTPILLVSMIMFFYLTYSKKLSYSLGLLAIFFFSQYLVTSFQGGWKAAAYGGRMYISSLPFFLVLIAKLLEWVTKKYSNRSKWLLISFFISLNILSMLSFTLFEKEASNNGRGTEIYTDEKIIFMIDEVKSRIK